MTDVVLEIRGPRASDQRRRCARDLRLKKPDRAS